MALRLQTGGTARRAPSTTNAQSDALAISAEGPTGPTAARRGNSRRSALANITNFGEYFGALLENVEAEVAQLNVPNYAASVLRISKLAFDHYIKHLAVHKLHLQGHWAIKPHQLEPLVANMTAQIESGKASEWLSEWMNDTKIWVLYLHVYAMTGLGRINVNTIEHINLQKQYPADDTSSRGSNPGLAAQASTSAAAPSLPASPPAAFSDQTVAPPTAKAVPINDNGLDPVGSSGSQPPSSTKDDEQENSEDEYVPVVDGDDDDNANANKDEDGAWSLDEEETRIVNAIKACPEANPLALGSLKARLANVLHHLSIANITLWPHLCKDVLKIMQHLARHKHIYPTGVQKKL